MADHCDQHEPQETNPCSGTPSPRAPIPISSAADGRTIRQMQQEKAAEGGYDSLEDTNLKRALRAFRKKLKSARLDDESRLGNRYVTSGRSSGICAITPPSQFPIAVWNKLVELGRLKHSSQGTFEFP